MIFAMQLYMSFMIFKSILHKNERENKLKTDKRGITHKNKDVPKINILGDIK